MLLVEQNCPFAVGHSERVYVLGKGRVQWEGNPDALDASPEVTATWLGGVEVGRGVTSPGTLSCRTAALSGSWSEIRRCTNIQGNHSMGADQRNERNCEKGRGTAAD